MYANDDYLDETKLDDEYLLSYAGSDIEGLHIRADDSVRVAIQKLMQTADYHTNFDGKDIDVYAHQRCSATDSFVLSFTEGLFGSRKFISADEATSILRYHFDIELDLEDYGTNSKIVSRKVFSNLATNKLDKISSMRIPLLSSYSNYRKEGTAIDLRDKLLYTFNLEPDNDHKIRMHITTHESKSGGSPINIERFSSKEKEACVNLSTSLQILENDVATAREAEVSVRPSYISLSCNQNLSEIMRVNLAKTFVKVYASLSCPMIKYVSDQKTIFKVNNNYVLKYSKKKDLDNFKKQDVYFINKKRNVLIFYVAASTDWPLAEIHLFESLRYEVKLKFHRKITMTAHTVSVAMDAVNEALDYIKSFCIKSQADIIPDVLLENTVDSTISGNVSFDGEFKWNLFFRIIKHLHNFFYVYSKSDSTCKLYYKRTENYACKTNVVNHLFNMSSKMTDVAKRKNIKEAFDLTTKDAHGHFASYEKANLVNDKTVIRKVSIITVEITKTNNANSFEFEIQKSTNGFETIFIIQMLKNIAQAIDPNHAIHDDDDSEDDEEETNESEESEEGSDDDQEQKHDSKPVKFLKMLQKADPALFSKEYPRKCPANENRQPNVITARELEANRHTYDKNYLEINGNIYVCPTVWCARTKTGMKFKDFDADRKKCNDPVILNNSGYFKQRKRHIGLVSGSEFPCCSLTSRQDSANDIKYVLAASKTTPAGRYSLLPKDLSMMLGNPLTCGGKMNGSTDCFLAYGLEINDEPFLNCIADLLGLGTAHELISEIRTNMRMDLYLKLEDGRICRRFFPERVSMLNGKGLSRFKQWFNMLEQEAYVDLFVLHDLKQFLNANDVVSIRNTIVKDLIDDSVMNRRLLREFMLWTSFCAFDFYLADNLIPKEHSMLLNLCSREIRWLNRKGKNIVIFTKTEGVEKTKISSSYTQDKASSRSSLLIMHSDSGTYEPIHRVSLSKHTKIHNDLVIQKIVDKLASRAKQKEVNTDMSHVIKALLTLNDSVQLQLINRDMKAIGLFTRSNCYIPFEASVSILREFKVRFIDDFLDTQSTFRSDSADFIKTLNGITSHLRLDEYHVVPGGIARHDVFVPLGTDAGYTRTGATLEIKNDASLFDGYMSEDARTQLAGVLTANSNWYLTFRNEMFAIIRASASVEDKVDFVRNASNPMPLHHKRAYIRLHMKKAVDESNVFEKVVDEMYVLPPIVYQNQICSDNFTHKTITQCDTHRFIITQTHMDNMFDRCLDDIMNPVIQLFHVNVTEIYLDALLNNYTFTDDDLISTTVAELLLPMKYNRNFMNTNLVDEKFILD